LTRSENHQEITSSVLVTQVHDLQRTGLNENYMA